MAVALTVSACNPVHMQRVERHTPAVGRHLLGESLARAILCRSLNEQVQCNRRVTRIGADYLVNLIAVKCVAVARWHLPLLDQVEPMHCVGSEATDPFDPPDGRCAAPCLMVVR